jgi:OFA family oxalate/formate antiporter-like MFS transporter
MMAFGISSLLLGNLAGSFIASPGIGWRATYVILGICLGVVLLVAAFVLRFPPAGTPLPAPKVRAGGAAGKPTEPRNFTTLEMVKRASFWLFFFFSITMAAVGNTVISIARDIAITSSAVPALAVTLVGVLSVCNGLGRLSSGLLFDRAGLKTTMFIGNLLTLLAPAVLLLAVTQTSVVLCVAGLCLAGLSYGFSPSLTSTFAMAFYGPRNFAANFSVVNTLLIPASFVATLAGGLITQTGSYTAPFILLMALAVCSLLFNFCIRRP